MGDEVRVNDIKGFSEDEAERLVVQSQLALLVTL